MKGLELLEKYPLSTTLIQEWFLEKMIDSLNTATVSDEFKDMMRAAGVEKPHLAIMIDANPRMLLDVFDENNIIIETFLYPHGEFTIRIGNQATTQSWNNRKEAELFAIEAAFEILEKQLTPKEETNEK